MKIITKQIIHSINAKYQGKDILYKRQQKKMQNEAVMCQGDVLLLVISIWRLILEPKT